ncbi:MULTISPECIES: acylphosphatase [Bacillus]|uniref:acylphosphatase n=1 Tax=Bacillus TaxID=1386 RepID=UPI0002FC172E|nr:MULTISPECIES: acylphosphatase [Bacillus]
MNAVSIIIEGHVQGVGFRYFTALEAANHHVTGWVRNTSDGNVEIEAEGPPLNIQAFIHKVSKGPQFADVTNVSVRELDSIKGYEKFNIKY